MKIAVVKAKRLEAENVANLAHFVYPAARVSIHFTGVEALGELRLSRPQLALLGLNFPDLDGVDLIEEIFAERLVGRILVISDRKDEHTRSMLLRMRVDGFLIR